MRSYNPFTGETYREALHMSRIGREMICLMEGRHVHPSTVYPGGVGTVATPTLLTDYQSRLLRCLDFIKKAVAMNDDVFDFFYQALPGYEEVGRRRILLGCWGAFNNPQHCTYEYKTMEDWGNEMFVTPGLVVDGELVTTNLVDINLGIRILLGSSYYEDWTSEEMFVPKDPLGNAVDRRHPWNQTTIPKPQKRELDGGNYSWVMSPRWFHQGNNLALDTGGGALARLWATALADKVHLPYVNATARRCRSRCPRRRTRRRASLSGRSRSGRTRSSATARGSTSSPTPRAARSTSSTRRSTRSARGARRPSRTSTCPTSRSAAASTRPCAACCRTTW
jgi:hydrogenase large subunit